MNILAIIPARGGSKGIPGKNLKPLAGLPMIAHAIRAARASSLVTRTVVSTDSSEIAETARRYGAEVVMRPAGLATDTASSESALLHAIETLKATGFKPELIVFLQCTSPLTTSEDINGTVKALLDKKADSALAVTPFHSFLWMENADSTAAGTNHDITKPRRRRQEIANQYVEAGSVYVMRAERFLESKSRFFGKTAVHVIPREHHHEIDDPADLTVADALLRAQKSRALSGKATPGARPGKITGLVLDFDGVMTDNRVLVDETGKEAVLCNRGDGLGLEMLKKAGLPILVLSKEKNPVVTARCKKLGLECLQGIDDKLAALREWAQTKKLVLADLAYLGNDANDLECLEAVGFPVGVADSHPSILPACRLVLASNGGFGAVRELCDLILAEMEK